MIEIEKKEVIFLENKGFVKTWLDDKSGWWMEKTGTHELLGDYDLCVQDFRDEIIINMTVKDGDDEGYSRDMIDTKNHIYSRRLLNKFLKFLK